nr:MAG TPA: hypothetical protein [Caudoviricetes sp.]
MDTYDSYSLRNSHKNIIEQLFTNTSLKHWS